MSEFNYVILSMILWNIITFIIYGVDKRNAIYGKQRISEKALFICAFMMGGMGALFGMRFFRHKTKHLSFKICLPLAVIVNIAVLFAFMYDGL